MLEYMVAEGYDCWLLDFRASVDLPYGAQLVDDVVNRTETAMPQAHTFLTMEIVLKAQKQAQALTLRT